MAGDKLTQYLENALAASEKEQEEHVTQVSNRAVPRDRAGDGALVNELESRGYSVFYGAGAIGSEPQIIPLVRLKKGSPGRGQFRDGFRYPVPFDDLDVHAEVALSLDALIAYGKAEGLIRFFEVNSAFRSVEQQRNLSARYPGAARGLSSRHLGGMAVDVGAWFSHEHFPQLAEDVSHPLVRRIQAGPRRELYYQDDRPRELLKSFGSFYGWYKPDGYPGAWHYQIDKTPKFVNPPNAPPPALVESLAAMKEALTLGGLEYSTAPFIPAAHTLDSITRSHNLRQVSREALYRQASSLISLPGITAATLKDAFNPFETEKPVEPAFTFSYAAGLWGDGKTGGKV